MAKYGRQFKMPSNLAEFLPHEHVTLTELVDIAFGASHLKIINFGFLKVVLHIILKKLNIEKMTADLCATTENMPSVSPNQKRMKDKSTSANADFKLNVFEDLSVTVGDNLNAIDSQFVPIEEDEGRVEATVSKSDSVINDSVNDMCDEIMEESLSLAWNISSQASQEFIETANTPAVSGLKISDEHSTVEEILNAISVSPRSFGEERNTESEKCPQLPSDFTNELHSPSLMIEVLDNVEERSKEVKYQDASTSYRVSLSSSPDDSVYEGRVKDAEVIKSSDEDSDISQRSFDSINSNKQFQDSSILQKVEESSIGKKHENISCLEKQLIDFSKELDIHKAEMEKLCTSVDFHTLSSSNTNQKVDDIISDIESMKFDLSKAEEQNCNGVEKIRKQIELKDGAEVLNRYDTQNRIEVLENRIIKVEECFDEFFRNSYNISEKTSISYDDIETVFNDTSSEQHFLAGTPILQRTSEIEYNDENEQHRRFSCDSVEMSVSRSSYVVEKQIKSIKNNYASLAEINQDDIELDCFETAEEKFKHLTSKINQLTANQILLKSSIEMLGEMIIEVDGSKASITYLEYKLAKKADGSLLDNKADSKQLQLYQEYLIKEITNISSALIEMEANTLKSFKDVNQIWQSKVDRENYDSFKDKIQRKLNEIVLHIKHLKDSWNDCGAAITRRQLLRRHSCLSCGRPAVNVPLNSTSKLYPAFKSTQTKIIDWKPNQKRMISQDISSGRRSCGGAHTTINFTNPERISKLNVQSNQMIVPHVQVPKVEQKISDGFSRSTVITPIVENEDSIVHLESSSRI